MTRRLSLTLVAAAVLPLASQAQDVKLAYGPQSAKYVLTSKVKVAQEMMGQKQEGESTTEQRYSLSAAAKGAGQLEMTLALDSMSATNTMGPPPDVSKAIGTRFAGLVGINGRYMSGDVTVPAGGDLKSPQAVAMKNFLPFLPATAKVGGSWSDTVVANVSTGTGAEIKNTVIYNYTLAGDTAVDGVKAWKLAVTTATTTAGKGNQQGQDFSIEGTGKGSGVAVISKDGVYLSRESNDEVSLTVTVDAMGMVIPISQSSNVKLSRAK